MRTPKPPEFETSDDDIIVRIYAHQELTTDNMAYSSSFEYLFNYLQAKSGKLFTRNQVWKRMLNLRRQGRLPTKGRGPAIYPLLGGIHDLPSLPEKEIEVLNKLLVKHYGQRNPDHVAYTEAFEIIATEFRVTTGRNLDDNQISRLLIESRKERARKERLDKEQEVTQLN